MLPAAGDEEGVIRTSLMFLMTLPLSLLLPVRSVGIEGVSHAAPKRKGCQRGAHVPQFESIRVAEPGEGRLDLQAT